MKNFSDPKMDTKQIQMTNLADPKKIKYQILRTARFKSPKMADLTNDSNYQITDLNAPKRQT
jgi:hypothetical protein